VAHLVDHARTVAVRDDLRKGQGLGAQTGARLDVGRVNSGPGNLDADLAGPRRRCREIPDCQDFGGRTSTFVDCSPHQRPHSDPRRIRARFGITLDQLETECMVTLKSVPWRHAVEAGTVGTIADRARSDPAAGSGLQDRPVAAGAGSRPIACPQPLNVNR
jgi:hypothetical protein